MKIERVFTPRVLATTRSASLAEAAAAMGRFRVGALVVMEDGGGASSRPVGIVTDRDLAVSGFASEATSVGAVMTPVVATIRRDADSHEALETMRAHGVRRLVVTTDGDAVCGMLSIDDLVDGISADLAAAAEVLKGDIRRDSAGLGEVKVGG